MQYPFEFRYPEHPTIDLHSDSSESENVSESSPEFAQNASEAPAAKGSKFCKVHRLRYSKSKCPECAVRSNKMARRRRRINQMGKKDHYTAGRISQCIDCNNSIIEFYYKWESGPMTHLPMNCTRCTESFCCDLGLKLHKLNSPGFASKALCQKCENLLVK